MNLKGVALAFLPAVSLSSLACAAGYGGVTEPTSITVDGTMVYLNLANPMGNPDRCTNVRRFALPNDPAIKSAFLSVALTAVVQKKNLDVWVGGCASSPNNETVPLAYNITMNG